MDRIRALLARLRLVRREGADRYMLMALVSFALSVSVTRLFLSVTGYPKIASGNLHIAHVLWGGLLLFIAALLPLVAANRLVYTYAAVFAGLGIGLFIDEVGKFITNNNDYFFPAAAPIVYIFFLLTLLLFVWLRSEPRHDPYGELYRSVEILHEMMRRPLTDRERSRLESQLARITQRAENEMQANVADSILRLVLEDTRLQQQDEFYWYQQITDRFETWFTPKRLYPLLVIGMLGLGLLALKNPFETTMQGQMDGFLETIVVDSFAGRRISAEAAPGMFKARLVFEVLVGSLLLAASGLMLYRRHITFLAPVPPPSSNSLHWGITLGFMGLLLSLTTMNVFLFYFEQFSTISVVAVQFALLIGLAYYRETHDD
jgi:hypothetical protein